MSDKPKKSNTTGMILALAVATVLLIVFAVGAFALQKSADEKKQEEQSGTALIDVKDTDISRVTIENQKDTYSIVQNGYKEGILQWKVENEDNEDIDQYSLKLVIQRCARLTISRDLGRIAEADFAQYGLDKPTATFSVTLGSGVRTFAVGSQYNKGYYMLEKGVNRLYTVAATVGNFMSTAVDEYRNMPGVSLAAGDLGTIYLKRHGRADVMLAYINNYDTSGFSWQLVQPITCYTSLNNMSTYLEELTAFKAETYVAADLSAGREAYGFDDPYVQVVLYHLSDEKEGQTILVGDPIENMSGYRYCVFKSNSGELADCRVYGVSETALKVFMVDAINLMERQFMLTHIDKVEKIELEVRGKTETVAVTRKPMLDDDGEQIVDASGEKQYAVSFMLGEEEIGEAGFRAFYSKLIGISAVAFLREDDTQERGEEFFTVRLHTTMTMLGKPDGEKITVECVFTEMDSNYYLVRFNGQKENICKVSKDPVDSVLNAYELCKQGLLPPIN